MMKPIEIDGQKFEYEISYYRTGSQCDYYTKFYQGTITESRRKYLLFGEKINKEVPKLIFIIWDNIEDCRHTKEHIKKLLMEQIALLKRVEEIKRGEII